MSDVKYTVETIGFPTAMPSRPGSTLKEVDVGGRIVAVIGFNEWMANVCYLQVLIERVA